GNSAMVSAASRPARAGFGKAKDSAIKIVAAKMRLVVCNAESCEFVRGFISGVPFEKSGLLYHFVGFI
ncbi:MAG: hypothetical protein ABLT11_05455, partial [Candidatus Acidiferrum sp.]